MNFAGPFDAELTHDSPVSLGGERFTFDSKPGFTQHHASDSHVIVPDAHLLFSGDYTRIGSDLIISGDDHKFVVGNYFKGETRPALVSKDGATLSGHIVDALTGHVHYAQASGAPAAGQVIGNVLKLSGSATAIRNGVSIELHIGDAVQKGDVVQTASDSSIGMTFVDGSAFGMNSNARMVLNEMIYDPNGSSNSSLISLVQGTITFVAGQTAKNGNMRVETPVATMGIRGTAVLVEIGANDGPTKFSVLVEPDGHTGSYNLYDKTTGDLIGTVSQAGQVTFVSVNGIGQPPTALEQLKTLADQQAEKALIQQVFQLFFPNYNPDNSNPKSQKTGFGSPGDNINPFLFNNTAPDNQPIKIIVIPGVGNDPVTGQPNPPRIFFNTKAQFSADTVTAEQSITSSVQTFKISDVVHIDDPDINNGPFFDKATPFVAGSAVIKSAVSTNPNLSASFLSQFLHIDQQTGEVTFDRLGFNFLGQGETATFMLQVLSQSGPDSALVIIPIIISGDNDVPNDNGVPNGAPTIVLPLSDIVGGVKEDTPVGASSLAKDGTITFRDVDLSDTHTVVHEFTSSSSGSILNPASNPSLPGFGPGTHLGTFTLGPIVENDTDTINTGTVQWHFSLPDNDPTLQSLAEGQTITQVYTITITDVHGALVTQTVTITITGTNDAPVLTADASVHQAVEAPDTTGAPDSVVDVATGTLVFSDLDLSDTHTASAALHPGATSVVWSGGNYNDIPQATRDELNSATTAAVTENNTDTSNQGSVGWEFKLPDHLFDFLAHGETLTLIYDVTVTDNNGVSSTQQVTVQIGAANDQPVITVIDTSATVQEDVAIAPGNILVDSGTVTFTDTDLTDTHTAHVVYNDDATGAVVSTALATALATALTVPASALAAGTHSFNWDFALDNSLVQYLAENETITLSYTITVGDNSNGTNDTSVGQVVTVVITGTNDAPTVSASLSETKSEGDASFGADLLANASDVDHGETATLAVVAASIMYSVDEAAASSSVPSGFVLGVDGHTLTVDPTDGSFNHLAVGESTTIVIDYDITDVQHATVHQTETITINGTNDAPTLADVSTGMLVDTAAADTFADISGQLSGADIDNGETSSLTYAALDSGGHPVHTAVAGLYGSLTVSSDGTYSYVADAAAINALHADIYADTFTIQTMDIHGELSAPATFTVNITGANDAPTVVADTPVHLVEATSNDAGTPGSVAALTIADVDGTASYDTTELLANGWIYHSVDDTYTKDGAYGTATLDAAHNLTYALDNNLAESLTSSDHPVETFRVSVIDDHGLTAFTDVSFTVDGANDAPNILSDSFQISGIGGPTDPTTVTGLSVSDPDAGDMFTVTASALSGSNVSAADGDPLPTGPMTLGAVNGLLTDGIKYDPTTAPETDRLTVTVTDNHGLSDTLNFIFNQTGQSGATLVGTEGKDIFFATESPDTFVFAPNSNHDTIIEFTHGDDMIDLQLLTGGPTAATITSWLTTAMEAVGSDTLLHLNGTTDTLLLKGVATLNASDFILHA